jgi:hypothetical protein
MIFNIKVVSHHQNIDQANISFENAVQIKYWGMPITNQNYIKRNSRLKKSLLPFSSKFVCYLSIMSVFPKLLLRTDHFGFEK